MSALDKGRTTARMDNQVEPNLIGVPMAAATTIYIGSLVCLNAAGYAVPASADNTLVAIGIADKVQPSAFVGGIPGTSVVNSGAAGALTVNVLRGVFKLENGDTIAQVNVGQKCYAMDDQTVAKADSAGTRPVAGYIVQVDSATDAASNSGAGVWVAVGALAPADLQLLSNLNEAAGAALTDADATIQYTAGSWRKLPASTLGAARVLTLGNTGAFAGAQMTITRLDAAAFTYTIKDNAAATLVVLPASKVNFADFQHDGTNWFLKRVGTQ